MQSLSDVNSIKEQDHLAIDDSAKKESRDFEREQSEQDGAHGLSLNKTIFWIGKITLIFIASMLSILAIIWLWHISMPECWRWLSMLEVQMIERILFSSIVISYSGKYFTKYKIFGRGDKDQK